MKANAVSLLAIFERKMRLEIPLFQRQYVWSKEQQWEPLWEDIERKFIENLEGRKDGPVHFLGAMVLDLKLTPMTHVEKRQVIDGQQRLTTFQIFLASFRDFSSAVGCDELAKECDNFLLNKGMMTEPEVEKFKVWPTQADRPQFSEVIQARSKAQLETIFPKIFRKRARKPDPRPRMVEAYCFFYEQCEEFFIGSNGNEPLAAATPIGARLEECFQALRNSLQVVAIDLEQGDDAQVIFETLNARGEPLLPADLLRNYIFLRAARKNEATEHLYQKYWKDFDDKFWRAEVKQGRLSRPRSDLFLQHFLASREAEDIPVKHLFVEYKNWLEKRQPFQSVEAELQALYQNGSFFRKIQEPKEGEPTSQIALLLKALDVNTALPLLLYLFEQHISSDEWQRITSLIESYLVRRTICGLTTKNYNRVFLSAIKNMQKEGVNSNTLQRQLLIQSGDSVEWPLDEKFRSAWINSNSYGLGNSRLVYILSRLNDTFSSSKTENIKIISEMTVEHIMPQSWADHWLLPDGTHGLSWHDTIESDQDEEVVGATLQRVKAVQTIGNLTILMQALNSAVSNGPWSEKKPEMLKYSLLPINQILVDVSDWSEAEIQNRSEQLFERALTLWPRPNLRSSNPESI